jgi:hypothetical protein
MNHAAIEFCLCIGEGSGAESLCRFLIFLQKSLPKSGIVRIQTQQTTPSYASLPKPPLRERPKRRLIPFTDVIRRLMGCIENDLIPQVEQILQIEFP